MSDTFLGLPVTGEEPDFDIRYSPPRPLADLAPLFHAVLHDDGVAEFGWRQADPDDDPTDSYVTEIWFRAPADTDGHSLYGHPTIRSGDRYNRCKALHDALIHREFDDVLREGLGEWCDVRVTRSAITLTVPADT